MFVFLCIMAWSTCACAQPVAGSPATTVPRELTSVAMATDPTEVAKALVEAIPNGAAVARYQTALMEIVRGAQGELDLAVLYDACTDYHRWHSFVIVDRRKDLAILEWVSQKIWEMPTTPTKKVVLEQYIGDIGRLIETANIVPIKGLQLAMDTVATGTVQADIESDALLRLFTKNMKTRDKELDDFIVKRSILRRYEAFCSSHVEPTALVDILRRNYPEADLPQDPWRCFYPPGMRVPCRMTRKDYESIGQASLPELRERIVNNKQGGTLDVSCKFTISRVFDLAAKEPKSAKEILSLALDREPYNLPVMSGLFSDWSYGPDENKAHPVRISEDLAGAILQKIEKRPPASWFPHEGANTVVVLNLCLTAFADEHSQLEAAAAERLQQHCLRMLFNEAMRRVRDYRAQEDSDTADCSGPLRFVEDNPRRYSVATKALIRQLAGKCLEEVKACANSPTKTRDDLNEYLNRLLTLQ